MNVLDELEKRILVFDGAMGTRLNALTGNYEVCVDAYNIDADYREIVKTAHRGYIDVGVDAVLTNTYGANRIKLDRHGFADHVHEINTEGVALAREVTEDHHFVGGSVGPLEAAAGDRSLSRESMTDIFEEQISALVEAGVDLLVLETFQDLNEAVPALKVARTFDLPVIFQVGGVKQGTTGTGTHVKKIAHRADRLGADIIGSNCRGPYDMLESTRLIAEVTEKPISVMGNAGSPEIDRGQMVFSEEPEHFRKYTPRWVEAGAVILGGCCGTRPEHIRAIIQAIDDGDLTPPERKPVTGVRVFDEPNGKEDRDETENPVEKIMSQEDLLVSVEMRFSRDQSLDKYLETARRLSREGISLFDVPDNAAANVAVDPVVAASKLQEATHIPAIMHLGASHRNLIATQSLLLGCHHAGIQGILAVTGDHPNVGDHDKYAEHVTDVKSSVGLMELMEDLNGGHLFNESDIHEPTNFFYGGGIAPGRNMTAQVNWLEQKVDAGAEFVFSQPLYGPQMVEDYMEGVDHLDIRKFVGILPITSKGNARFFASGSIPGIVLPDRIMKKFEEQETDEDARKLGMDLTLETIDETSDFIEGLYIIPPFGQNSVERVIKIVRNTLSSPTKVQK